MLDSVRTGQPMSLQEAYDRGFQLRCDGRYAEARVEFAKILQSDPSHANAKWQIGLIQGFEGDFDGSIQTLSEVVAQKPDHVNARFDLGMTYTMLGMVDEACAQFQEVLRLKPDHQRAKEQLIYCP